jgi:NADH-quinone oxidoreductase subunit H
MSSFLVILFFGGWLSLFSFFKSGWFWFFLKLNFILFSFIWVRATLPRYRYDQLMSIGWKVFLPLSLGFLFIDVFLILIFLS